jgi:RND superfamily putative drug exporter
MRAAVTRPPSVPIDRGERPSRIASLARASARRPWIVIAVWAVVFLTGGLLNVRFLSTALTTDVRYTNNPDSKQAATLMEARLTGPRRVSEVVIVRSRQWNVGDPAFVSFVHTLHGRIAALGPGVVLSVTDTYATPNGSLDSLDGHTTLLPVTMAGTVDDAADNIAKVHAVTLDGQTPAGFEVSQFGEATVGADFTRIAEKDVRKGEAIGIVVALVILVLVFGSLVAASVPILLGVVDIGIALGLVAALGQLFHFSFIVTNMITMMGLAVGIDYSLFVVSRFREERAKGLHKLDAIAAAGGTASRAVLFSGMTVVLALGGMLILPLSIFQSLALGAIIVVLVAILASLTLLPAVLGLLGDRVNALRIRFLHRRSATDPGGGFWDWATKRVTARPVVSLLIATGLLLSAGVWLFGMRTGFNGISSLPSGVQSERAFGVLAKDFTAGMTSPAQVVVDGPVRAASVRRAIESLQVQLLDDHAFGPAALQANEQGTLAVLSVPLRGDPNSPRAYDAIRRLRSSDIPKAFDGAPATVVVGGATASSVDFFALTHHYTPLVFLFVLGLSFLLLMVVFRSIVLPVKAILLNLLSVAAAYGLVVLVNQKGVGASLFGFRRADMIEAWFPLFLFSVLFGLSMDYHVFLLSRIRERYEATGDNREAVAFGLRSTGKIITGAAVIMVAVFAGFAAGKLVMLQEMGFGLAVAVLLDATIVRSVLVPSSMELLGKWNWYLPSWLRWLPQVRFEAPAAKRRPPSEPRKPVVAEPAMVGAGTRSA